MLDLKDFVASIQEAVNVAANQIQAKNLELLDDYFVQATDDDSKSANATREEPPDRPYPPASLRRALHCGPPRKPPDRASKSEEPSEPSGPLRPKMAVLQYPVMGPDGATTQDVWVPLISIVPQSQLALDELKLTLKVEMAESGDSLKLSVPNRNRWWNRGGDEVGTVEIVIKSEVTNPGRMEIVEGYTKALRAQIPG